MGAPDRHGGPDHRSRGLLGFGVALSWTIGREFSDGTITGLFALPVSRPVIALAKLLVHLLWITAVAVALTALTGTVGLALRLGRWTATYAAHWPASSC